MPHLFWVGGERTLSLERVNMRVSYRDYKQIYGGARTTPGSYSKEDKTIEITLSPLQAEVVRLIPDEYARQYQKEAPYVANTKLDIARDLISGVREEGGMLKTAPKWAHEIERYVKAYDAIDRVYHGDTRQAKETYKKWISGTQYSKDFQEREKKLKKELQALGF